MAKKKESEYAAQLRALGCVPWDELQTPEETKETMEFVESLIRPDGGQLFSKMTRGQRRKLVSLGLLPNYLVYDNNVYVTDETGTDWHGPPDLDLELELGFHFLGDNFEEALKTLQNKMN